MYIFLVSLIATVIIGLCFFKNKTWENRYLLLGIGAGVAFIATLTTNFVGRSDYDTTIKTVRETPLESVGIVDSLFNDYNRLVADGSYDISELTVNDSTEINSTEKYAHYILYGDSITKIGYWDEDGFQRVELSEVYIAQSTTDKAYFSKLKLKYNLDDNPWVGSFSLPKIESYECFFLPPSEYSKIPKSLIRNLPI